MADIPATYRAYFHEGFGDLATELQLRADVPQEILKTDQVRIQVHAAGLNPADYKIIEIGASFMPVSPSPEEPFRVGFDVAGVVAEVGSDVMSLKVGDEVLARGDFITRGSCAEYVVIGAKYIVQKPAKLRFQLAAGLPVIGLTSYQALTAEGHLEQGERVLVLGGSSGTGVVAIQIAKILGASFVAATTSTRNIDFVLSFGADRVIDYTAEKWAEVLEAHSIDLIYDCGVEPNAWNEGAQRVLKANTGRLVTISREITPSGSPIGATYIRFRKVPNSTDLALVTQWVESDRLRVPIDSVYAFEDLLNAFKAIKAGHTRGKVILEVIPSKP